MLVQRSNKAGTMSSFPVAILLMRPCIMVVRAALLSLFDLSHHAQFWFPYALYTLVLSG